MNSSCVINEMRQRFLNEQLRQCNHREPLFLILRPDAQPKNASPLKGGFCFNLLYDLGYSEKYNLSVSSGLLRLITNNKSLFGLLKVEWLSRTRGVATKSTLLHYSHRLRPIRYM